MSEDYRKGFIAGLKWAFHECDIDTWLEDIRGKLGELSGLEEYTSD